MELRHLRYFVAAAEEQHFGRAAELLFVTRPAVSQTIVDLETELGVKLFHRHAQKVTLTAAGTEFLKHARTLIEDLSRAVQSTKRIGQGKAGILNVGYGSLSLLHPLFRDAIKQVNHRYPEIELSLQEMPSSAQIEAVRAGRLDAGFVYVTSDRSGKKASVPEFSTIADLDVLKIERGGLGIAMTPEHRLANEPSLKLTDLSEEHFVVVRRSITSREIGFIPHVVQEVSNIATQINLISVGVGMGVVVTSPGLRYPPSVRVIPLLDTGSVSQFGLVWRAGLTEPVLHNFIEIIRELAQAY